MNPYLIRIKEIAKPNKYTKWYCSIISKALERPQNRKFLKTTIGYVELHHILPESFGLGGEKDKINLVFLTAKEHFIVHLCATKMFDSVFKNKMIFAFRLLKSKNPHQASRVNSRMYGILKPDFKSFVRLYKGSKVKYLYDTQSEEISKLELDGWSKKMTSEFKQKYVCGMLGKKHSDQTKKNMSQAQRGTIKLKLRGQKHSEERIEKTINSKNKFWKDHPEKYEQYKKDISARSKEFHASGVINLKGEKNGMFGRKHSDSTKKRMSEARKKYFEDLKNNPEEYQKWVETQQSNSRKVWENEELRNRSKITNSKAYSKYGIHPKDFYEQKLKPLLYLGFLPTAIIRYKLLDMHPHSIKAWIKKYGSKEDMDQFNENRKNGAGANKAYIRFQEEQYKKHFFCGPPHPNDL